MRVSSDTKQGHTARLRQKRTHRGGGKRDRRWRPASPPSVRSAARPRRLVSRPGSRYGLTDLGGSEGARRQPGVAETDFDLDDAVPAHAPAHGKLKLEESELEVRGPQPLCRDGDLTIGGKTRPAE